MKSDLYKPEVLSLIRDWGLEGYGFYKIIKSYIKRKERPKCLSIDTIKNIAERYNITSYKALRIIKYYNLFEVDDDMISLKQSEE